MPELMTFEQMETPWQDCLTLSWESFQAGSVPVGSVVIHRPSGRSMALGRNRNREVQAPSGQVASTSLAHAEINALLQIRPDSVDPGECVLYTSLEPCPLCMGALYMSGIRTVAYACRDAWAGSTDLLGATPYMSRKGITVIGPPHRELEDITMALQVEDLLDWEHRQADALIETWRRSVPSGVELGLTAHREGLLARLAQEAASAESVVDQLLELLRDMHAP